MYKLVSINRKPNIIALSSAIGVIIGLSPYVGFHTLLAIAISYLFNLPVYPLILGAYITNPLTLIFIYAFCFKVGVILTDSDISIIIDWSNLSWDMMIHNLKELLWPLFVGCHVVGLLAGILVYFIVYYFAINYKEGKIG